MTLLVWSKSFNKKGSSVLPRQVWSLPFELPGSCLTALFHRDRELELVEYCNELERELEWQDVQPSRQDSKWDEEAKSYYEGLQVSTFGAWF